AVVTNLEQIDEDFRQPNDVGAFPWIDLGGIIYNSEKVPEPPKSWRDLFDPKYKGKVAVFDGFWSGNGLVATAYANGGSIDDVEPALKIYEEAAKSGHIHSLFTSNAQIQQLLASGEVWIAPHFRGIVLPWIKEGAPFGYAAPDEGQVLFPEGLQLLAGSTDDQLRVGRDLINASLKRENIIDYAVTASVVPVLKDKSGLPEELANDPALSDDRLAKALRLDYTKIATNHAGWLDQWNRRVKVNLT
ncbi:extracellular solute-binding protein, partial [Mesorhizobium sp. M7A.F.Ca.US.006.01.1.1]|uniref:ABC transporter substrate-binding protein n=1 Tax=Mesorhizobium sp. M7A.F.Ca.US.006.01.1.1 TaxID=2496707 RepID=UPI000FCA9E2F